MLWQKKDHLNGMTKRTSSVQWQKGDSWMNSQKGPLEWGEKRTSWMRWQKGWLTWKKFKTTHHVWWRSSFSFIFPHTNLGQGHSGKDSSYMQELKQKNKVHFHIHNGKEKNPPILWLCWGYGDQLQGSNLFSNWFTLKQCKTENVKENIWWTHSNEKRSTNFSRPGLLFV